jgi:hypothetical protein
MQENRAKRPDHPYTNLPDFAFWNRSVSGVPPFAVDPVVDVPFQISQSDAVATAGSCFAQHIAQALRKAGMRHFVAEPPPGNGASNEDSFSARYGNIYTARQLLQLFDRAYGTFTPELSIWQGPNGGYVDPFRPRIQPRDFPTEAEVLADRARHLASVRRLFENLDVFVFTLGLTEAWEHKADHAVLPLAPGVAGGEWDSSLYEFRNYSVEEVQRDMIAFIDRLREVNPSSRIILTVSPVPLAATYRPRHVLVSTCLSKAILRVAAESCTSQRPEVCYFPSYEIITGPHSGGRYYDSDLRTIKGTGVDHVMRVFFTHFVHGYSAHRVIDPAAANAVAAELERLKEIVCDEELLSF